MPDTAEVPATVSSMGSQAWYRAGFTLTGQQSSSYIE